MARDAVGCCCGWLGRLRRNAAIAGWILSVVWLVGGASAQNAGPQGNPSPPLQSALPDRAATAFPSEPVIGIPPYASPTVCEVSKPDSTTLKQALQGATFEPLSEVRRSILDCLSQVQAVIVQTQKDLPAAESKWDRAQEDNEFFNRRESPDEEIKRSTIRLQAIEQEIKELEGQLPAPGAGPAAVGPGAPPINGDYGILQTLDDRRNEQSYLKRRIPEAEAEREYYEKERRRVAAALGEAVAVRARLLDNLSAATRDDQLARNTLDRVDDRIDQLLSIDKTEGEYKLWLSIAFAVLIGVVIGGFFWLARMDQVVRQQIFSGDAGLQFVTLFALVIAIILFGIVGILEGRELAALLGGISGYILGRSTSTLGGKNAPPPSPPTP